MVLLLRHVPYESISMCLPSARTRSSLRLGQSHPDCTYTTGERPSEDCKARFSSGVTRYLKRIT